MNKYAQSPDWDASTKSWLTDRNVESEKIVSIIVAMGVLDALCAQVWLHYCRRKPLRRKNINDWTISVID